MPSLTLDGIRKMHRAFAWEVILGPDWAEDSQGNPKFLADWKAKRRFVAPPVGDDETPDKFAKVKDRLRLQGVPEHLLETVIQQMIQRRRKAYEAAMVKRKV